MKQRIQRLIDIYCNFMFGVDRDAGWHAPSQLEALQSASMALKSGKSSKFLTVRFSSSVEHQVNDKADEKMINEMQYVRNKHYDFELAKMLFEKLEDKQLVALLGRRYLQYVYKKPFKRFEVADYLGMTIDSLKHNKKKGFMLVEKNLTLIEAYEKIKPPKF